MHELVHIFSKIKYSLKTNPMVKGMKHTREFPDIMLRHSYLYLDKTYGTKDIKFNLLKQQVKKNLIFYAENLLQ